MNIYSRIDPTLILHIINRVRDVQPGRVDLVEADNFLQCAVLKREQGTTFKPHKHIDKVWNPGMEETTIAQESWIVVSGLIAVTLYDIDDTVLHTDLLEPGDCSITLRGGHNYTFVKPGIVYEYKSGPYWGQEADKVFI
jgi:hypothetical protein